MTQGTLVVLVLVLTSLQFVKATYSNKSCSALSKVTPQQSCFISQILKLILKIVQCELNKKDMRDSTSSPDTNTVEMSLSNNQSLTTKTMQPAVANLCSITYLEQPEVPIGSTMPWITPAGSQVHTNTPDTPIYVIMTDQDIAKKCVPFEDARQQNTRYDYNVPGIIHNPMYFTANNLPHG